MNAESMDPIPPRPEVRPLADATVDDFASRGIVSCQPDAPLDEVAWLMAHNRVHAVLVVDDEAAEPPVIADADVIAAVASGHFDQLRAVDIAGQRAISIRDDDGLERAAELLTEHRASHLVVRDRQRTPVGILSTLDLAQAIGQRD